MSGFADQDLGHLVCRCLLDAGIRRTGWAYRYLSDAIRLVLDGARPNSELWERIAQKYGKRAVNVRTACRRAIQKAYHDSPERFCAALDDIYFTPPRTRDFIAAASRAIPVGQMKGTEVQCRLADILAVGSQKLPPSEHSDSTK